MALSITTELQSTYYTCDIPNIGINTDRASLVFTLKVKSKQIFKSTYYASNGKVTVRDILSIIEAYFIQQGYSYQTVNITADDGDEPVTATFHAVYCHFHSADTRTDAQKAALLGLLTDLKQRFPEAVIHGHRDFAKKACPCFDATSEYAAL